jgi:hypothetical protein
MDPPKFFGHVDRIYPIELERYISQEQLGLLYTIPLPQNVNFSFTCSNIPAASACGVSISQLI